MSQRLQCFLFCLFIYYVGRVLIFTSDFSKLKSKYLATFFLDVVIQINLFVRIVELTLQFNCPCLLCP